MQRRPDETTHQRRLRAGSLIQINAHGLARRVCDNSATRGRPIRAAERWCAARKPRPDGVDTSRAPHVADADLEIVHAHATVAVFGNAGGGKSTLARRLAQLTQLSLYPLDLIQFKTGGGRIPHEDYLRAHADLISRDEWIIDGFGCVASARESLAAADTLIYIDLPLATHYRWVTKRLIKGAFVAPEGWPTNSPLWRSTLDSWRVVGRCERHLAPGYRQLVVEASASKRVHHLKSARQIRLFLDAVEEERAKDSASAHPTQEVAR